MSTTNATIHIVKEGDKKSILEFLLSDYLYKESINVSCGLSKEEAKYFFTDLLDVGCSGNESYILKDSSNVIVGCRLAYLMKREDDNVNEINLPVEKTFDNGSKKIVSKCGLKNFEKMKSLLLHVDSKIFKKIPNGVDTLINFLVITVLDKYEGKGYEEKLMNHDIELLKEKDVTAMITITSAPKIQNMFIKFGYECIYSVSHDEFYDENGCKMFDVKNGTDSIKMLCKKF
uniref:N-acetyltransferase domain-containing protein n=1 Tax=Parastrongyloides trichosuri TaxID=131310 RepID=A0A0N4ZK66_PARTI